MSEQSKLKKDWKFIPWFRDDDDQHACFSLDSFPGLRWATDTGGVVVMKIMSPDGQLRHVAGVVLIDDHPHPGDGIVHLKGIGRDHAAALTAAEASALTVFDEDEPGGGLQGIMVAGGTVEIVPGMQAPTPTKAPASHQIEGNLKCQS